MDTFFMIFKKMVVGMVFVIFGMSMVYVPQHFGQYNTVPEAHAGASFVFDPVNWIENAGSFVVETATNIISSSLNLKEFTLDAIAWAIAKQIVSGMVSSLVDWINSGFQGSPAFVQDLGGFLLQTADETFGEALQEFAPFICSPFRLDVQIAVAVNYDQGRLNEPPTCTITGVFQNFDAFIAGDFSQGGWDDWFKITSNPSVYTEYGSILSVQGSARARVINAKGEELDILGFGNGFLSGELCQNVASPNGTQQECFIAKPGRIIADSLNKALGAGQDGLIAADEISEIIAALLGQLANTAITGAAGLLGLSGGTGYTYRGYSRGSFAAELLNGNTGQTGGVNTGTTSTTGGATTNPGDITFATSFISDSLTQQQTSLTRINTYISQLQNFANNPLNSQQNRLMANTFLTEANNYRVTVEREITDVGPIVQEYITLETEYVTATPARRIEIRSLQSDVVQRFNAVGLTNPATLQSVFGRWDSLLSQNVGTQVNGSSYVDLNNNGQEDFGEADLDGNGVPDIQEICANGSCVIAP